MGFAEAKFDPTNSPGQISPPLRRIDNLAPYAPYATLPKPGSWDDYQLLAGFVEHDPFAKLESLVKRIQDATKQEDVGWLQSEIALLATIFPSGKLISVAHD